MADVYELTRANVQKGWEKIRQATDGKRRVAFAVGDMGAEIPVVLVVPGVTPSQAKTRLASAAYLAQYKSGEAPKGIDLKRTEPRVKTSVGEAGIGEDRLTRPADPVSGKGSDRRVASSGGL